MTIEHYSISHSYYLYVAAFLIILNQNEQGQGRNRILQCAYICFYFHRTLPFTYIFFSIIGESSGFLATIIEKTKLLFREKMMRCKINFVHLLTNRKCTFLCKAKTPWALRFVGAELKVIKSDHSSEIIKYNNYIIL